MNYDDYNILVKKKGFNFKNKKKLALIMMLVLMLSSGVVFAFFSYYRESPQEQNIIAGNIYLLANTKSFSVGNNLKPMSSSEGMTSGAKHTFTVKGVNTSTRDISYGIYIN